MTVLTLVDYARTYDRVSRDALLLNMLRKGVSPRLIRWIQAWLANRQRWVTLEGAKSKKTILKQGVPQGSVLSPLLFLFYIDDLYWASLDLCVNLFNYDVAILAQGSKLHIAEKRLQQEPDAVTTRVRTGRCCSRSKCHSVASSRRTHMNQNDNLLSI